MASRTINVDVDIELDEFTTTELICEIINRMKSSYSNNYKDYLINELKLNENIFPNKTLEDTLKVEHLLSVFNKYTLTQIEELLP